MQQRDESDPPTTRSRVAPAAANVVISAVVVVVSLVTAPALLGGLAVAGLIGGSLEALVPAASVRRGVGQWATDLTHAIGNRTLILPIVGLLSTWSGGLAHAVTPEALRDGFHSMPLVAQVAVLLLITDLANYAVHRAMHEVPALWRLHRVHHSTEQLDWLATARGHPLDLTLTLTILALPSYALGATTQGAALITFLFLYPFLLHTNARVPVPVTLDRVVVTPRFHHWHHAADAVAHGRNLGSVFTVWDRVFGTAIPAEELPTRYGADDEMLARGSYLTHLVSPWRGAVRRRARAAYR